MNNDSLFDKEVIRIFCRVSGTERDTRVKNNTINCVPLAGLNQCVHSKKSIETLSIYLSQDITVCICKTFIMTFGAFREAVVSLYNR